MNQEISKESIHELTRVMKEQNASNMVLHGTTTPDGTDFVVFIARGTERNHPVMQGLRELEELLRRKCPIVSSTHFRKEDA